MAATGKLNLLDVSEQFYKAAKNGTVEKMEQLWREHSDEIKLDYKNYDGMYWIVKNNDQKKLDFILNTCQISQKAIETNAMNSWGIFAVACSKGNLKIVKQIYEYFNLKYNKELQSIGEVAMRYTIYSNEECNLSVLKWLLQTYKFKYYIYYNNFYRTQGAKMQLIFSEIIKSPHRIKKFISQYLNQLCENIEILKQIKPYIHDIHESVIYEAYINWLNYPEVVDWFEEVFQINSCIITNKKVRDYVLSCLIGNTILPKQNKGVIKLLQMVITSNAITEQQLFDMYITSCGSCNEELVEYILVYLPKQSLHKYERSSKTNTIQSEITQYNFLNAACKYEHSDKEKLLFSKMVSQTEKYMGTITIQNVEKYLPIAIELNLIHVVKYLIKNLKNTISNIELFVNRNINVAIIQGRIEILDCLLTEHFIQIDNTKITSYIHKVIKSTSAQQNTFEYLVQKFNVTNQNYSLIECMKTQALVMEAMVECKYEIAMYLINELGMQLFPEKECKLITSKCATQYFSTKNYKAINKCLSQILSRSSKEWIQKIFASAPNCVQQKINIKEMIKAAATNDSYEVLNWLHDNYKEKINEELGVNIMKNLENQLLLNPSDELEMKIAYKKEFMVKTYIMLAYPWQRLSVYNAKQFYNQYNVKFTEKNIQYIVDTTKILNNNKEILEHVYKALPDDISKIKLLKKIKLNIEKNNSEEFHSRLYKWAKQQLMTTQKYKIRITTV